MVFAEGPCSQLLDMWPYIGIWPHIRLEHEARAPPMKTQKYKNRRKDGSRYNDARPVEPHIPKNDIAKETQRLDTQVTKCKVGVAWIDLLEMQDRLKFGKYNDRPPNDAEINKLIISFKSSGIVPMKDVSAIPIIIDIKRIERGLALATGFDEPDAVPELKLVDTEVVVVASGQHRLAALCKYHQTLEDEMASLEKKRAKIAGLKNVSEEHVATYEALREEIGSIMGLLDGIGKWGVIVYDSDKLLAKDETLAMHLSRNNTLHEFKETEEEILVSVFKKIQEIYKNSPVDKRLKLAKNELQEARNKHVKNARIQKVLHHDSLCILLATRLLHLGPHFRRRHEFSVTWLAKSLDVCMGLYVSWIESRCKTLAMLSSRAPFPSHMAVRKLVEKSENGDKTAKDELTELRRVITSCLPADEGELSIWAPVLDKIDSHASIFADHADIIEEMSPSYIAALSTYRNNVIRTLRQAWLGNDSNRSADGENTIFKHLDSIIARVALHLTPTETAERAPEPLLGGFLMDYAWNYMIKVKEAIAEICRWFEALLDYWRFLHGKTHAMDDWSTVMLSNIAKDPRFEEEGSDTEVMHIIWDYRQTLVLRLENCMIRNNRRLDIRPKDKKAFDAAVEAFKDSDQITSQALQQLVLKRRGKHAVSNRDLSNESLKLAGTMALHVTAWEWHSLSIKNPARDIQPCINAITLESKMIMEYRPRLFKDKWAGSLRRLIELALCKRLEPKQLMTSRRELYTVQEWTWWDGIVLSHLLSDPSKILAEIHEELVDKQHKQLERLALETQDRDAIQKAVNYIVNMAGSKVVGTPHSRISAEVFDALVKLVQALELNTTRLRTRSIANDEELLFNIKDVVQLQIVLPPCINNENTLGYEDQSNDDDVDDVDEAEPAIKRVRQTILRAHLLWLAKRAQSGHFSTCQKCPEQGGLDLGISEHVKNAQNRGGQIWAFLNVSKMPRTGGGRIWAFLNMSKMPRTGEVNSGHFSTCQKCPEQGGVRSGHFSTCQKCPEQGRVTEYQGIDNNDLHWNRSTGGSQSTRVSTTMISTGTVPSEARLHDKTKTLSLVKGSPSIGSTKQLNRGNYSDKNAKIKQNQAKSERGFDPGHKDKDKEYDSQDYDSKKSRKQAKDKDKDHDGQDYDTISKSRIRNAIVMASQKSTIWAFLNMSKMRRTGEGRSDLGISQCVKNAQNRGGSDLGISQHVKNAQNRGGQIWAFLNMSKMPRTGGGQIWAFLNMSKMPRTGGGQIWAFLNMSKMPRTGEQFNRGNYSDKNAKIKQSQAKSERGFDLGHKEKDKEYDSQDYDSKKSRKQGKDKDKDHDSQDYDTISKSRIRNAIVKTTIRKSRIRNAIDYDTITYDNNTIVKDKDKDKQGNHMLDRPHPPAR
ncbi:uncharacterized protein BJ212DRAFT_1304810 [Suillus subaureus]|uniref:Uncharacterized protein n=1 Tax=Suillus subaureus TaxID=48587 RepID=A0A9P7J4T4_9AGAM|nr:uncharacterized protein BJ212DRAFT_1304810 [Suillus subaureus]KAG1802532.1 hypothetical protein BJ212DRAFT_1304810 [Suillus subaureus]